LTDSFVSSGFLEGRGTTGRLGDHPRTHEKRDRIECTNYRGISIFTFPGKVYAKYLDVRARKIIEAKMEDTQRGCRPDHSTADQNFTL